MKLCVGRIFRYTSYQIGVHNSYLCFEGHSKRVGYQGETKHRFHRQMDGPVEIIIQTLDDMLRFLIIDCKGNWYKHLPLV